MNARQTLSAAADWLGWQDEDLSARLRNAFDALRLYDYAQSHPDLPEMADDWAAENFIAAIGYNPFAGPYYEATTSGADDVVEAMRMARNLIDSVAFVRDEGDTVAPLAAIDQVLGDPAVATPVPRAKSLQP